MCRWCIVRCVCVCVRVGVDCADQLPYIDDANVDVDNVVDLIQLLLLGGVQRTGTSRRERMATGLGCNLFPISREYHRTITQFPILPYSIYLLIWHVEKINKDLQQSRSHLLRNVDDKGIIIILFFLSRCRCGCLSLISSRCSNFRRFISNTTRTIGKWIHT
jgi:hypothetical protein